MENELGKIGAVIYNCALAGGILTYLTAIGSNNYNERKKAYLRFWEKMRFWSVYFGLEYPITDENQKQKFERVFGFKKRVSAFEPMEKCRRDIFEEFFGKLPD